MIASQIESPFADGYAHLQTELSTKTFRKEEYCITYHHYVCEVTGQSFSTDESDALNVNQVYNQYRTKHHVIFPKQIQQMRAQYGLTAARMSLILDLGPNQYRYYEDGEVPSVSSAKLLRLATNPRNFRELVEDKKDVLTKKNEYENLIQRLRDLIEEEETPTRIAGLIVSPASTIAHEIPNEYTGFVAPDPEKFAEMVLYFFEHLNYLYQVRLLKLLFYSEFYHYKRTGVSITGYQYKAITHGPVPQNYEIHIGLMVTKGLLDYGVDPTRRRSDDGGPVTIYTPKRRANMAIFSETEKEALEAVRRELGFKSRIQIEELSHEEDGWIANQQQRDLISYQQYAFTLKAL